MVNSEVFGGLVSAMSRGESLQKAMFSLFNAGYKKNEIEEAAKLLQSQTPVQIAQKEVMMKKINQSGKKISEKKLPEKKVVLKNDKIKNEKVSEKKSESEAVKKIKSKQNVSHYDGGKNSGRFNRILDETIKNLQNFESNAEVIQPNKSFQPPIIIQKVSDYGKNSSERKTSKSVIIILFILLVLLIASLAGLLIFKDKIIDFFNSLNF